MLMLQAQQELSKVFNAKPVFLFDGQELHDIASASGLDAIQLGPDGQDEDTAEAANSDVVFVISDRNLNGGWLKKMGLEQRNVLQIPNYAFDGGLDSSRYTLEMCATLDVVDCVRRNASIVAEFETTREVFSLESACSTVRFSLFEDIKMMQTATEQILTDGADFALSTYTEVALIPISVNSSEIELKDLGYIINGSFDCHGCLVATHFGVEGEIAERKTRLTSLINDMHGAGEFPLRVSIEQSRVVSVTTKTGKDVSKYFFSEMDSHLGENIYELGLGTNAGANLDAIDWTYNSPINESALGFHIAIGDGTVCPHVDFVCADKDAYDAFFVPQE